MSLERLGDHQQTFSAVYSTAGRGTSGRYIERVLAHTGAAGNMIEPTEERLWDDLARLVWHQDEPFQSTSIFAQWCVMGLARAAWRDRAAGRPGRRRGAGRLPSFRRLVGPAFACGARPPGAARECIHRGSYGPQPTPPAGARPCPAVASGSTQEAAAFPNAGALQSSGLSSDLGAEFAAGMVHTGDGYAGLRDLDAHLSRLLLEDSLPTLLRYEDRNSMAFSIEARVPFLDYRLIEHVFTRASHLRIKYGWTKWIQRQAVSTLLPHDIVWRRDKVGFETPEQQWFRAGKSQLLDILQSYNQAADYLDMSYVRREAPGLIDAGDTAQVWRWLNLTLWLRQFNQANGNITAA